MSGYRFIIVDLCLLGDLVRVLIDVSRGCSQVLNTDTMFSAILLKIRRSKVTSMTGERSQAQYFLTRD